MSTTDHHYVGKITFDLSGKHYLQTFYGRFPIPEGTIEVAFEKITTHFTMPPPFMDESIAGLLARGRVKDGKIVDLSYWINGHEWPQRDSQGETKLGRFPGLIAGKS